jgi:hypothetical protein
MNAMRSAMQSAKQPKLTLASLAGMVHDTREAQARTDERLERLDAGLQNTNATMMGIANDLGKLIANLSAAPALQPQVQAVHKATPTVKAKPAAVQPEPVKADVNAFAALMAGMSTGEEINALQAAFMSAIAARRKELGVDVFAKKDGQAQKAHAKAAGKAAGEAKVRAATPAKPFVVVKPNGERTHSRFETQAAAEAWLRSWVSGSRAAAYRVVSA